MTFLPGPEPPYGPAPMPGPVPMPAPVPVPAPRPRAGSRRLESGHVALLLMSATLVLVLALLLVAVLAGLAGFTSRPRVEFWSAVAGVTTTLLVVTGAGATVLGVRGFRRNDARWAGLVAALVSGLVTGVVGLGSLAAAVGIG